MFQKYFLKVNNRKSGYTIIETMIAISLFLIVVMVGMNSLLNANVVHRKLHDMRSILDNFNFVMEDMSKNIRTGYDYQCFRNSTDPTAGGVKDQLSQATLGAPRSCADGWAIAFESAGGNPADYSDQWVYYISTGKVFKSTSGADASDFTQLPPQEVMLESFSGFFVLGAEPVPGNIQQPIVTLKLVGDITYKNTVTPFAIQTSVSQRLLDILP